MLLSGSLVSGASDRGSGNSMPLTADSLPTQWPADRRFDQALPVDDGWWRQFNDPVLDSLIAIGIDHNINLEVAARRMQIARISLAQTRAQYLPTLSLGASWSKARPSGALAEQTYAPASESYFDLGLTLNWQIDIFGRIAAQSKAKKASWQASRADYAGAMVTLAGDIANAYVQLRVYQAEKAVAEAHLASQAKVVNIAQVRFDTGLSSKLDLQQAITVYASTEASIPGLESAIHKCINQLAVLLGIMPAEATRLLESPSSIPPYLQIVQSGVPIDLLRRRPDIVAAERTIDQMAAEVGIAKKDYLPMLALSATAGTEAHNAGKLFTNHSFTWSVVPTLSWTLFDGLQRRYNTAAAKENLQIAVEQYNLALLQAVTETDNAMIGYLDTIKQIKAYKKAADAAEMSLALSLDLYKRGLADFTNVADAQTNYLNYTNSVIVAQGNAVMALIDIYEALGGGWPGE